MDENLPAPVPPAATAVVKFDRWKLPLLVREIVMDVNELPTILKAFNIDLPTFQAIEQHEEYKLLFERLFAEWHKADSTEARLKIQSAFILEQALPKLGAKAMADDGVLRDQVEAAKFLKSLAGIGDSGERGKIGEKFAITINMGAQTVKIEKNVAPTEAAQGGAAALPADGEGALRIPTLELVAEGPRSDPPPSTDS
jgi:hypothetical protein